MRTAGSLELLPDCSGILVVQSSFRGRFPEEGQQWAVFRAIRTALVVTATLVAMFVPGFGNFISLIGSLACALLAFVIPTICYLKIFGSELQWWQWVLNALVVALGVVGAVVGTVDSINKLIHA